MIFMSATKFNLVKVKELDSLAEAVKRENQRLQAYRSRGG